MRRSHHVLGRIASPFLFLFYRFTVIVVAVFMISGCAHVRAVPLYEFQDDQNDVVTYYGVAYNNVIIPEMVIDKTGSYPDSESIAVQRFKQRRPSMWPFIVEKYDLPSTFTYQMIRLPVFVGIIIVSPIAIPILYIIGLFSTDDETPKISDVCTSYFAYAYADPTYSIAPIRNEFIEIRID